MWVSRDQCTAAEMGELAGQTPAPQKPLKRAERPGREVYTYTPSLWSSDRRLVNLSHPGLHGVYLSLEEREAGRGGEKEGGKEEEKDKGSKRRERKR